MPWPQTTEYNEAIQNLRTCVSDDELREGEPAIGARGLPMPYSGNFADVYKVHCPRTGNTWAVKCFTREVPGLRERYREISAHLRQARLPFTVDFQYVEPGIRAGGQWTPFLKMRWVEGSALNQFVYDCLEKPKTLRLLLQLWAKLAARLRNANVAHADLQHGNVLLVPAGERGELALKLIDYDGMYVPSLAGRKSGELGHPSYQHPQRLREGTYSLDVDRFSHLAIYCAIRCLTVGKRELWNRFDSGDNLLFRERDFRSPGDSEAFHALWSLSDREARTLMGRLVLATQMPLARVPLLEEVLSNGSVVPLSVEEEREVARVLQGGAVVAVGQTGPTLSAQSAGSPSQSSPWWATGPAPSVGPPPLPGATDAPAPLSGMSAGRPSNRLRRRLSAVLASLETRFGLSPGATLMLCTLAAVATALAVVWGAAGLSKSGPTAQAKPGSAPPVKTSTSALRPSAPVEEPLPLADPSEPPPVPLARAPFDEKQAKEHQLAWARHLRTEVEITNSLGIKMVLIPPGEFIMGSPPGPISGPRQWVRITQAFYLGVYEVTQEEFQRVMGRSPDPRILSITDLRAPAHYLAWNDADEFCRRLSDNPDERAAGRRYRLPTEAQWEYACRAGTTTRWSFGDAEARLGEYAWHARNSGGKLHMVGQKRPNAWGMFDMHGNACEWCSDRYRLSYGAPPAEDPVGTDVGAASSGGVEERGCRGGIWRTGSDERDEHPVSLGMSFCGFRVACVVGTRFAPQLTSKEAKRATASRDPQSSVAPGDAKGTGVVSSGAKPPLPQTQPPAPVPATPPPGAILLMTFEPNTLIRRDRRPWIKDLSGKGNDGELRGAGLVAGKVGSGLGFDGNSSVAVVGSFPAGSNPRTVAAWIRCDDVFVARGEVRAVINYGVDEWGRTFGIAMDEFSGWMLHGFWADMPANVKADRAWHHHAVTYDGTEGAYFFDGGTAATERTYYLDPQTKQRESTPRPLNTATKPMLFGMCNDRQPRAFFKGSLDEVAVYDRVLTAEEISALVQMALNGQNLHK